MPRDWWSNCRVLNDFYPCLIVVKQTFTRRRDFMAWICIIFFFCILAGAITGHGDRKSRDPRAPMIWDNFSILRTNFAILTLYIRANLRTFGGCRLDVVMLSDQTVRVERFSCRFFTAMAGNKARNKNQGSLMWLYALSLWERWVFQDRKYDFKFALW